MKQFTITASVELTVKALDYDKANERIECAMQAAASHVDHLGYDEQECEEEEVHDSPES